MRSNYIKDRGGVHLGTNVDIRTPVFFDRPKLVSIGDNSFINRHVEFHNGFGGDKNSRIEIGKNCFIAMNVQFIGVSHKMGPSSKRADINEYNPIKVGDGCWIGANAVILGGVTIGNGAVIAAGSVVTKNVSDNTMVGGVPAKKLKDLKTE